MVCGPDTRKTTSVAVNLPDEQLHCTFQKLNLVLIDNFSVVRLGVGWGGLTSWTDSLASGSFTLPHHGKIGRSLPSFNLSSSICLLPDREGLSSPPLQTERSAERHRGKAVQEQMRLPREQTRENKRCCTNIQSHVCGPPPPPLL